MSIYVAACCSLDYRWYRARVINVNKEGISEIHKYIRLFKVICLIFIANSATVFYLDFGNTEELPIHRMCFLIPKFLKRYPIFAIPVSIFNVSFKTKVKTY